jgi:hypothetical protein
MASKNRSHTRKAGSKPATAATPATSTNAVRKERKPRKPPLERAIRLAGLLIKARVALAKNVKGWSGEATREQRLAITRTLNEMGKLDAASDQIAGSLAFLVETKYAPKIEHLGGRAKSFPVGAPVALKEKRYDAEIHGPTNAYTVKSETAKGHLVIQAGKGFPPFGVPKGWLEKRDVKAAPAAAAPAAPKGATPEVEPDAGDDEDENPGLDAAGE